MKKSHTIVFKFKLNLELILFNFKIDLKSLKVFSPKGTDIIKVLTYTYICEI
jgi:hypothetical protein